MANVEGSERCDFCGGAIGPAVIVFRGLNVFCGSECMSKDEKRAEEGKKIREEERQRREQAQREAERWGASPPRDTMTLDELLEELRDCVLDASPEDLEAAKLRYDALHRRAKEKLEQAEERERYADRTDDRPNE